MLETADHGSIRELRLARPPANALDPALVAALDRAVGEAPAAGAEAMVLSGAPGLFSGGLDVPALLALDRAGIRQMWQTFFSLMRRVATAEIPVIAALTGHSPAGGTVIALFADYRVMAEGRFKVGLNEVQVGLPVPDLLVRALGYVVGPRQAERLVVPGLLLEPEAALRVGLVDEVVPAPEVIDRAIVVARELVARPRAAMLLTRRRARRPLHDAFAALDDAVLDEVTAQWFAPEAQQTLRALAERLGKAK